MGNTFSCVSGKAADDSPKKDKAPKAPKPVAGLPLQCSKPRVVKTTEDTITISWDKPTYDGGKTIIGYAVKMGREGQGGWRKLTMECDECSYQATGLEPDTLYKFYVQAENENGFSPPSETSDPIRTLPLKLAAAGDADAVAVGDENENDKKDVEATAKFGASAEKYVVKDEEEKSRKSSSSSSHGKDKSSAEVEVEEKGKEEGKLEVKEEVPAEVRTVTTETKVTATVPEEKKVEEEAEAKAEETTIEKSESKESVKTTSSSSSDDEKKDSKSVEDAKNDIAKAASAGVSVEVDFSANGSSVGHGTGVLSSFLDSRRVYQYSNDSLLDEENEEDAEVKNKNRANKNMDIQKHDKQYFIEIETVDAAGNSEDDQYDENDHYIHTQVPMIEPVEFDCDQSNRLSIISEKSMEDNLSPCSPDKSAKDGQHFVFAKKEVNGTKSEANVSKIPMFGSKIPRQPDPVIINPISAEIPQPKSKIPPPQIKPPSGGKAAQDSGPKLGMSFGLKAENEERVSPREEPERRTSIPTLSTTGKVESKITPPSSIPRRGSAPKTFIPLKKDSSGDSINATLSGNSSASEEADTKIPTGIPRRKSVEKADASSKITPPSSRIVTGIPRGSSGIRPPGSFGFQARVDTSS
ncbi:uncharacterized protein LOC135499477 [Lineus longissimus]|uniref:uncharacterized protein LOC135499477 n=1 Tax=Lineus longissimus TaxID=88925 RepID=UPI002B4EABB8